MKAENVQRQNIFEWKKEKCLENAQIQEIVKKPNKERQSARKSINPTRTVSTIDMDTSTITPKNDEIAPMECEEISHIECEDADTVKPPILEPEVGDNGSDNKRETLVLTTEEGNSKGEELPSDKEIIKDALENSDQDIEKVWANIRKDLTVTKIDMNETNENIKEDDIKNIPIEKPEPPEEEEPSDWEDQSDAENDPVGDSVIEPKENVSGECVLILSDEEIEEEERTVLSKSGNVSPETNNEATLPPLIISTKVPGKNIPVENNSCSANDISGMAETLCNEDASNSKSDGVECSEFNDECLDLNEHLEPESAQSLKSPDSNHSAEDPIDQQEDCTIDNAESGNSVSSNEEKEMMPNLSEELTDSTKITIKRNLSSGDELYEVKKPKLDQRVELNNGDNCHAIENGTDDVRVVQDESEKPCILTHQGLEELIAQEICEYMVEGSKSYLVNCKKKHQELEKLIDTWKKKAENLQKEVNELRKEQKKLLAERPRTQGSFLKKGTRTVGISVRLSQEVLTRTVGTNVNLPQRLIERVTKISPKPIPKIIQRSDSTTIPSQSSTTITTSTTQEKAPVPLQLIANTAKGLSKVTVSTANTITTKPLNSSISIIDLTREDAEPANSTPINSTGGSLTSLSGGSVIMSSTPVTRTINIGTPSNTGNVVAVPLVYTTIPSAVPLLPSVPNASSTPIRTSQTPTAIVSPTLNHTPRITYLLPQATASLPISTTRTATPSTIATNTRPPMQAIFLRMSPPINPSGSTSRFPVQSAVPVSLPSTISVVPVSRSSATSTTLPQRPQMQTVMVSSIPVSGTLLSGNNTTITTTSADTNQLTSSKTSVLTKSNILTSSGSQSTVMISCVSKHPAPLPSHPPNPENPHFKVLPPKPALKISRVQNGIVLSWNMILNSSHADVSTYQLFAYQEGNGPPNTSLWKKVGDVKALPLPMACTLTQFVEGHTYHFAVRAIDIHNRLGPFSDPTSIVLVFKHGVSK